MTALARHLKANFIQWLALVVLVSAILSASRAAFMPMVYSLGRFVLPFLVVWVIYRFVKGRLETAVKKFQDQVMQNIQNSGQGFAGGPAPGSSGARGQQVIDLCPKCGVLQTAAHRC